MLSASRNKGFTLLETVIVLGVVSILVSIAVPRLLNRLADRSLQNAAHLIQGDLRLAQQIAVSRSGSGPRVEMCFRSDGYDVYPIDYADRIARDSNQVQAGSIIKAANAGEEYRAGVTVAISPSPPTCASPFSGQLVAFSGAGTPVASANPAPDQILTLTFRGRTYRVMIAQYTGRATVSR